MRLRSIAVGMKQLVKKTIGPDNWARLRRIYRRVLRKGPEAPEPLTGTPLPLAQIGAAFGRLGIGGGDLVLVHSSVSTLGKASPDAPALSDEPHNPVAYADGIIDLLLEAVGPAGTVLMPTEGNGAPEERARLKLVFDYRTTPSNRGLITELFRRRPDAFRSVHPWYNITGIGPLAHELIQDHARSTPYTMDVHSPWYKFTMRGGKLLFLGADLESNSLLHLPEYVYPAEYPRKIYHDKPVPLCYHERDGSIQTMPVKIHIPDWRYGEATRFCQFLDLHHHLYARAPLGQTEAICCLASRQFDALCAQMRMNVCWYDARNWE